MSEVHLENLSLQYPLYGVGSRSLKRNVLNLLGAKTEPQKYITHIDALKKINLTLRDGDYLGLVGHNGAGKSTLLKVMSGIYEPVQGKITIKGALSALLGSSVGMEPELTGYENIKLTSKIKNYSKQQIMNITSDIETFTELGDFLNLPVKTYSSGMQARLGFAISTAIHPDILILDEVMGTGDAQFIHKAKDRMQNLLRKANILVLASHSTELITQFCNKLLWLDHGHIKGFGDVDAVMQRYLAG